MQVARDAKDCKMGIYNYGRQNKLARESVGPLSNVEVELLMEDATKAELLKR